MGDVFFSIGKADIAPEAQRSIEKLAGFLTKYPSHNVLIEGHTDNTGRAEFNLALSQKRAEAVKDLLVTKGSVRTGPARRVMALEQPVAPNDTPVSRQQNRRVEVVILSEGVSPLSAGR